MTALYGPRLIALFLFGSYARGTPDQESDLDILIVLDRLDSFTAEIGRTSEITARLALAYGVSISRVFVDEQAWRSTGTTFLRNVRAEAIPA